MSRQLLFYIVFSVVLHRGIGTVNFALHKSAVQSTTLNYIFNWTADKAVDGNSDGNNPDKSMTCSSSVNTYNNHVNHTWEVDITRAIIVKTVTVYGRTDGLDHLGGVKLYIGNVSSPWRYNQEIPSNSSNATTYVFKPNNAIGSVISLMRNESLLVICEVTVEGECLGGMFSEFCNLTCGKCFAGHPCNKENGTCPLGCDQGRKGTFCKEDCERGNYGYNCNETCGNCLFGNNSCSITNGTCSNGCIAGWQGHRCYTGCVPGKYGYNCNETCGNCFNGSTSCNTTYGHCNNGCKAGWLGDDCKTECDAGTYGLACNETCGYCLNGNNSCLHKNGHCNKGCQAGWKGETCKSADLKIPETRIEISILGGSVGGAVAVVVIILVIVLIIIQRRRRQKSPPSGVPSGMDDRNVYENSTSLGLNFAVSSLSDDGDSAKGNKTIPMPKDEKITDKLQSENPETYYNVLKTLPRGMVSLSDLWDYVQEKCLDDKHFAEEFETLPSGPQHPTNVALRPENRNKNRYKDLYAYDVNRVQLKPLGNDENDYINASFVDGYSKQRMYIASQGTTKQNLNDFWRMLWQYDVEKVVMLTGLFEGGKHKCELYWPEEEGQTSTFGCVSVTHFDTDLFADYVIRTLEMSVGNKSKSLTQFHYTAWPDKGVPRATSSVVLFWNRVNRVPTNKPIVVHCSAGIGRTGTYIALDILVSQGRVEGNVNVSACVSNIRRERVNMVQTKEQYIFLHETLVEALMLSGTATTSDKFPKVFQELLEVDGESGKLKLQLEYERLHHEDVNHETVYASISTENALNEAESQQDEFADAKKPENKAKNRYDNILPADRHRVFLNSSFPGRNDYINAVVLPSHRRRQGFILTQMPLTGTVIDFWRMIHDLEVRTIVMLNTETSKAHDIGVYWPKRDNARYGPFSVRLSKQEEGRNYIQRILSFTVTGVEQERFVTQFQCTNWPEHVEAPESTAAFLDFLDIIGSWQNEDKPIIVHCLNGAERSGLYCVISTVIERLKLEKDVAITQTIKRMRAFRHQIIPNYEQFRFCHECIIEYMKTFETYTSC